jgi:hypothetical protein
MFSSLVIFSILFILLAEILLSSFGLWPSGLESYNLLGTRERSSPSFFHVKNSFQ